MNWAAGVLGGVALCCALFYAGWHMRDVKAEAQWAEYEAAKVKQWEEQRLQLQRQEAQFAKQMKAARQDYSNEKETLQQRYDALVAELDTLRLQQRAEGARDANAAPKAATTPAGVGTACRCEPLADNGRDFQRLYTRALNEARKCDELAARYNALLRIYKQAEQQAQIKKPSELAL